MKLKNVILIMIIGALFLLAGCTNQNNENNAEAKDCGTYKNGDSWQNDCNTCSCNNGEIVCTLMACGENNITGNDNIFEEFVNEIKFNQNLTNYEKEWLTYLEMKYPNSKIYHIRTKIFNCENCYELSYKKDRAVIKIKVLNGEKTSENTVTDDIATEIENENVCKLFQGNWNECPKVCETDEEACATMCGLPVCEFDYNTIKFNKEGEKCGTILYGDCEYGLKCYFESNLDDHGICQKK